MCIPFLMPSTRGLPSSAKKIKLLYGVEAYFVNDVDDRVAIHGETGAPFDSEIVCFDIETTGLNRKHEVIRLSMEGL